MKKQTGFTLIELVVVIVILGILAATALPKFISVASDARAGVIRGVEGSMRAVGTMVYGKSSVKGEQALAKTATPAPSVTPIAGSTTTLSTHYGYPAADTAWSTLLDLNPTSDFDLTTANEVRHAKATTPANCKVTYAEPASAGALPTYTVDVSGC